MAAPTRMTLATPMITPSSVRKLRNLCARIESSAREMAVVMLEKGFTPETSYILAEFRYSCFAGSVGWGNQRSQVAALKSVAERAKIVFQKFPIVCVHSGHFRFERLQQLQLRFGRSEERRVGK